MGNTVFLHQVITEEGLPMEHRLANFFSAFDSLTKSAPLEQSLALFFDSFREFRKANAFRKPIARTTCINYEKLASLLNELRSPLIESRKGAFHCKPWELAGLNRDEVRNSAVLAWLLNPRGSHGLGDIALTPVLKQLHKQLTDKFPVVVDGYCSVRTEYNPDGDISNRVDIEIDSKNFYLIIEVKINAWEGKDQIKRYADIATKQAGQRPWAIVFLTPSGRAAETAENYSKTNVLPLSWRELAKSIQNQSKDILNNQSNGGQAIMARHLVKHYLEHMSKL